MLAQGGVDKKKREGASLRFDIDEGPGAKPVAEQLRDALSKRGVRVIDMFHDWARAHIRKLHASRKSRPPARPLHYTTCAASRTTTARALCLERSGARRWRSWASRRTRRWWT
jgi:hypothetical protein